MTKSAVSAVGFFLLCSLGPRGPQNALASQADSDPADRKAVQTTGVVNEAEDQDVQRGAVLFRLHCASCHGKDGSGDGTIASELRTRPADLTRIAKHHKGEFPAIEISRIIDGRIHLPIHGSRDMPVWGLSFQLSERLEDQEPAIVEQIQSLVAFLKTIQIPPRAKD